MSKHTSMGKHTFRTITPGAKWVKFAREPKPGKDAGMTKSRHIWRMPKDIGFVTHFVNAGARNMWNAIQAPAREPTSSDPTKLHEIILDDAREPTTAERRNLLKRVPIYRGMDVRVARSFINDQKRAAKLKARAKSNRASSMLKSLLAGAS